MNNNKEHRLNHMNHGDAQIPAPRCSTLYDLSRNRPPLA